jgi:endonuclease VIII
MPEGDTIFRAARTLQRALGGRVVTAFSSVYPALTRVDEDAGLVGRTIDRVESRGKHLLIWFSGDLVLRTHMRMSGSWHLYRPGEPWRRSADDMRVLIGTDTFVAVGFNIPIAEFETRRTLERVENLGALGPDLLADEFDVSAAIRRVRSVPANTIAEALLNQRAVAGIGNIFKSETLFLCRLDPFVPPCRLSDHELERLLGTARRIMRANVTAASPDQIVTYNRLRRSTQRSNASERLWVYRRAGRPCRTCGTPIAVRKHGLDARSTYWCPKCQGRAG